MDKRWEAMPMYYLAGRYTSLLNFAVSITYVFAPVYVHWVRSLPGL